MFFGSFISNHDSRTEPTLQGNNLPGYGDSRPAKRYLLALGCTHIFSSTLTNEFRRFDNNNFNGGTGGVTNFGSMAAFLAGTLSSATETARPATPALGVQRRATRALRPAVALRLSNEQAINFNIQHEAFGTVFTASYAGSEGHHLRINGDYNQGINGVRPITPWSSINIQQSVSNSNCNGLWLSANKRLARGLTFSTSYTWSKSIDNNSVGSSNPQAQDYRNLAAERALSDFDARNRWVLSGTYLLPFQFNHPNFYHPVNNLAATTFGQILQTRTARGGLGSSRQLQLGLKLIFRSVLHKGSGPLGRQGSAPRLSVCEPRKWPSPGRT